MRADGTSRAPSADGPGVAHWPPRRGPRIPRQHGPRRPGGLAAAGNHPGCRDLLAADAGAGVVGGRRLAALGDTHGHLATNQPIPAHLPPPAPTPPVPPLPPPRPDDHSPPA